MGNCTILQTEAHFGKVSLTLERSFRILKIQITWISVFQYTVNKILSTLALLHMRDHTIYGMDDDPVFFYFFHSFINT